MTRSMLTPLTARRRRIHPQASTRPRRSARSPPDDAGCVPTPTSPPTDIFQVLHTHNHHFALVPTSPLSPPPSTAAQSIRSTIPPPPCCFDQCSSMTPKPTAHRAHRSNSVYSTPSSRPARHPSSLHRFGKFNPASRRAFHALFSRRLRHRHSDDHQPSNNTDSDSRIADERVKLLTDENARLRARVVELMSRLLCSTTEGVMSLADINDSTHAPGDVVRVEVSESHSTLAQSFRHKDTSTATAGRAISSSPMEFFSPPSRAPSDGITPAKFPESATNEKIHTEVAALSVSLENVAKENDRLKKRLAELRDKSQKEIRIVREEKDELEERLGTANEDREHMQYELCELREWSRRNLAQKEAIIETVKKEFEETQEEVKRLTELIANLEKSQSEDIDSFRSAQMEHGHHESYIETEIVLNEEKVSTDGCEYATMTAEGSVTTMLPTEETSFDKNGVGNPSRNGSIGAASVSASMLFSDEGPNKAEIAIEENEVEGNGSSNTQEVITEEKETDDNQVTEAEEQESSEASHHLDKNENMDVADEKIVEKIKSIDIGSEQGDMDDLSEKRFREEALSNPLMKVEREQIIVGHFCGHVIQTVGQLVDGRQQVRSKEEQVKQLIAKQWEKWVAGSISKVELIDNLVEWVRKCSEKGSGTDVVQSFNAWYVAQYTQYKCRNRNDILTGPENNVKIRRSGLKAEDKSSRKNSGSASNSDSNKGNATVSEAIGDSSGGGSDGKREDEGEHNEESVQGEPNGTLDEDEGDDITSEVTPEAATDGDAEEDVDSAGDGVGSSKTRVEIN